MLMGGWSRDIILFLKQTVWTQINMLLKEQSDLSVRGLTKMFLNHFSRWHSRHILL